jgi:hypothetical protein
MNPRGFARGDLGRGLRIALSILLPVAGCSSGVPTATEDPRPVKTMIVDAGDEPHVRSFPGTVEALKKVGAR